MSEYIDISRDGKVQIIRMNRPEKKNALTRDMYGAMAEALIAGDADDEVRCQLLLGTPGCFTAGNDIGDFLAAINSGPGYESGALAFLRAIITTEKPLVAGVDGLAIGIGTTMLMHCDMVFASPGATFKTPFLDLGILPEAASTLVAPLMFGYKKAFSLLLMGEELSAIEAEQMGLVSALTGDGDLQEQAIAAAHRVAARPPVAMALARRLLRGNRAEIVDRMEEEFSHFAERMKSDEAREAFMSFMNRGK